jgi:hypothetical protein
MPASLICEHKNQVGTFKRNFIAGQTPNKIGYVSEDDKRVKKIKFRDMKTRSPKSDTKVKSEKKKKPKTYDLRDIIERHSLLKQKQK